ncbi:hypothetical protein KIH23_00870 [Flavobacterium sp. CYK-55]|uniref:hypothetical protein n=1 Tax=Flavobacterium sp. CYK-55 TaxID=2835529 RepID=UPI001BCA95B1|nr:hypothetical protein [Flavobacterium sp. CYK-55]MBS7785834.1 hypothetical protein [Flavobacterium sp. CYK-55]
MRKAFIVLSFIFTLLGIVFVILPMGTLGFLPVGISLLFSGLAFAKSQASDRSVPKYLLMFGGILFLAVIIRVMMPDEVAKDSELEQHKIESKQEDLKDLEELEAQ